jgi:hypothetical protein
MSKEPWKRAYNLTRTRQAGLPAGASPAAAAEHAPRPRLSGGAAFAVLLLALLLAGGWYLWAQRGVLIPRYSKRLPAPVAQVADKTPLPAARVDAAQLDSGLGIGLALGSNYLELVSATEPWKVNWTITVLGQGHLRLTAPGVKVYSDGGKISGYDLDVKQVYAEKSWAPWQDALRRAGVSPDQNWRTATGAAEMPHGATESTLRGGGGHDFGGEPANSFFTLHFASGWLVRVEAGLSTLEIQTPPVEPAAPEKRG